MKESRNFGREIGWINGILLESQEHLLGGAKIFREITLPSVLPCSGVSGGLNQMV